MPELLDIATRIAGMAGAGEQVEAYVAHSRETDVRVYGGEIESLSSAESEGVGVRVIRNSRQGFAYAGSLDPRVIEETLAEARDNAGFATPDPHAGLAEPDGVEKVSLDLWREDLAAVPTADKVALAIELEARARGLDARVRQAESADYGDALTEAAVASSTGVSGTQRRTGCHVSVFVLVGEGEDTQTGGGYSVGRSFSDLDINEAADDAVERAVRMIGARKTRSARLPVVFDKRVTTSLLAILGSTFSGEAVLKGRSMFAERLGQEVAHPSITLVDDPTEPAAYTASGQDAEGLATRRNVLIDAGVASRFLYDSYSA
ncbi:MAG: TldD/PmbA family protein, partial [Acidimicrobiales bacterium]